jgi:hypothetical protein
VKINCNRVEELHQTPDLSPEAEERLLMVMGQFIEQKFKILDYEELCKMLNLTPFEETATFKKTYQRKFQESFQKSLKEELIQRLIQMIDVKFSFSRNTINKLATKLNQLTLEELKTLFADIFHLKRLKDLNAWIDQRLAAQTMVDELLREN